MKTSWLTGIIAIMTRLMAGAGQPHHQKHDNVARRETALHSPNAMRAEHELLNKDLTAAMKAAGETAKAAKTVEEALAPHFRAKEKFALPPLSLLERLGRAASGKSSRVSEAEIRAALEMSDMLRTNYDQMLREHQTISKHLQRLASAAKHETKPEQVSFANRLMLHAQHEEQVLYPATLILGDYLRQRQEPTKATSR